MVVLEDVPGHGSAATVLDLAQADPAVAPKEVDRILGAVFRLHPLARVRDARRAGAGTVQPTSYAARAIHNEPPSPGLCLTGATDRAESWVDRGLCQPAVSSSKLARDQVDSQKGEFISFSSFSSGADCDPAHLALADVSGLDDLPLVGGEPPFTGARTWNSM